MRTVAVALLLALTGCNFVHPTVFRDPTSGQVAQCNSNNAGGFFPIINGIAAENEVKECSATYRRMGWLQQ
jgi:hypothetical protein